MTLKKALIATGIWLVVLVGIVVYIIWYLSSLNLPDAELERRGKMIGPGLGLFAGIVLACIWIPFASRMGAGRRAKREAGRRKKGKPN